MFCSTLLLNIYESSYSEERLYAVYSSKDIFAQIQKLRKKILDQIIDRKLIMLDYIAKTPFKVPRQYVENLIDELAISYGCVNRSELREKAKAAGTSIEELRKKARIKVITQIMVQNYIYTAVNLTPREVHEYYQKNNWSQEHCVQPAHSQYKRAIRMHTWIKYFLSTFWYKNF